MDHWPNALREELKEAAGRPERLIHILHRIQETVGYISAQSEARIADHLDVTIAHVHGVVTFYHLFHTSPRGQHTIRLCQGTACHVGGGDRILQAVMNRLGVAPGETTSDGLATLETVACLGACALSPVMIVDDAYHGSLTVEKALAIIDHTLKGSE